MQKFTLSFPGGHVGSQSPLQKIGQVPGARKAQPSCLHFAEPHQGSPGSDPGARPAPVQILPCQLAVLSTPSSLSFHFWQNGFMGASASLQVPKDFCLKVRGTQQPSSRAPCTWVSSYVTWG